jgi:hypothetical protein
LCDDTNSCTSDVCGGASGCAHPPVPDGTRCPIPNYPFYCFQNAACVSGACLSGAPFDQDRDGHADPNCGGDDCNDVDEQAWHVPSEVANLMLTGTSPTTLAWDSQTAAAGPGTIYDIAAGYVPGFEVSVCLAPGVLSGYQDTLTDPDPGQGYWYLIEARNSCGAGGYGSGSDGVPRPVSVCP